MLRLQATLDGSLLAHGVPCSAAEGFSVAFLTSHGFMELTFDDVEFLLGSEAQGGLTWLAAQSRDSRRRLALTEQLRHTFSPHQGSLLLEQWELSEIARQRGVFREPRGLLLERSALRQATCWVVAEHRAAQIRLRVGAGVVAEVGCGIGGDTLELARQGPVKAWEIHAGRARAAQHNVPGAEVHQGDFFSEAVEAQAIFLDPARRSGGGEERRTFDPEQYQPPLSRAVAQREKFTMVCIKAAPGLGDEHLPPECEVEFISHERTCKEAVLWLYPGARGRRASVHTAEGWFSRQSSPVEGPGALEVGGWIHEPDPALLRARALGELARDLDAGWLDGKVGYLVGSRPRTHPLAQSFEILDIGPLHAKSIQKRIQGLKLWPLEIKKRGVEIEPEEFRRQLKLKAAPGCSPGVLLLTRRHDDHLAILARRPV